MVPDWLDFRVLDGLDTEERLSQLCRWLLDADTAGRPYGLILPGTRIAPGRGIPHRLAQAMCQQIGRAHLIHELLIHHPAARVRKLLGLEQYDR